MLAADKLLLRSTVKQRAIQLREKELSLFNDNFNAVGTQSAVLAGFAMTSFAEIDLPHNAYYFQKVLHRRRNACSPLHLVELDPLTGCDELAGMPSPLCDHLHLCQPVVHCLDDLCIGMGLGKSLAGQRWVYGQGS